jgi:hypothetical protein
MKKLVLLATALVACAGQIEPASQPDPALADPSLEAQLLIKASAETEKQLGAHSWEIRGDATRNLVVGLDQNGQWVLSLFTAAVDQDVQTGRLTFASNPQPFTYVLNLKTRELAPGDERYQAFAATVRLYQRDLDARDVIRQYDDATSTLKCLGCGLGLIGCSGNIPACIARKGQDGCIERSIGTCGGAALACAACAMDPPKNGGDYPSPLPFGPVTPSPGGTGAPKPSTPAVMGTQPPQTHNPPPPDVCEEKDSKGNTTECWCEDPDHAENDPNCTND